MSLKEATPGRVRRHDRRLGQHQMDLFSNGRPDGDVGTPVWPELPAEAKDALIGLMTQLILEHSRISAVSPAPEASRDL